MSDPRDSVHGILQARIPEWVPIPSSGDLPNPGIEPGSPALQADSLLTFLFKVIIDMYVLIAILLIVLNLFS